jgi:ribosomal protein S18 acetylase RimI-like enzyme
MPIAVALTTQQHDPEELYQLFRAAMEPYVDATRGTPWNEKRERTQFLKQLEPLAVRLILFEGQVVGFVDARLADGDCFLHSMIVAPEWQSKGIGSAVMAQLKAQWERMSLTVLKTNPRARHFYERAGFREVGQTEYHYQMAWASNPTMERDARKSGARPSL